MQYSNKRNKTKKIIVESFLDLYTRNDTSQITVRKLCERAGVNRSTFYTYYTDVYELKDEIVSDLVSRVTSRALTGLKSFEEFNPNAIIETLADFIKEYGRTPMLLLMKNSDTFTKLIYEELKKKLEQTGVVLDEKKEKELHLYVRYHVNGVIAVMELWNKENPDGNVNELIEKIAKVAGEGVITVIKKEIAMKKTGTTLLKTDRLLLRRHVIEDADILYQNFGLDQEMFKYSGWNPYATKEMAEATVRQFIDSYGDEHFYGWAIEYNGRLIGTIGAYDFEPETGSIEIGCSIERGSWNKGFAGEAVKAVTAYLMEQEGIRCIKAWCAADNIGSSTIMERAGMKQISAEKDALEIDGKTYDKINYELICG